MIRFGVSVSDRFFDIFSLSFVLLRNNRSFFPLKVSLEANGLLCSSRDSKCVVNESLPGANIAHDDGCFVKALSLVSGMFSSAK